MAQDLNVGMKCVKYMLFVSNFMFVMVGVLLISFGSTIKSIYHDFEMFMEDHYFSPAQLTVAIGVIILLISAFGCAAAIKESTCMVNMFALLLSLALILEISASIAAYAMRTNIEFYINENMKTAMNDYSNNNEAREAVDFLQNRLGCCGIHVSTEWLMYNNNTIPDSCCLYNNIRPMNGQHPMSNPNGNNEKSQCQYSPYGCLDKLVYIMTESTIMLGTGALCIAFVQILGIAFAIMLAKSIRRLKIERETQRWQNRQELYLQLARGNEKNSTPVTYLPENNPTATDA